MTAAIVLSRLVEAPALVEQVRGLPPQAFAALVRTIGVEDAGAVVALATTEQLVAAFDEDLFGNARPGERETFDAGRFATWLDVLVGAGDAIAAARIAELSLDFVVHAFGQLVLVLDHEALLARIADGGAAARRVDKAIDSSLAEEELDGYLVVARRVDGWDATLAVLLALDRDHRGFLEDVLDRCSAIASDYLDDFDALVGALRGDDALADEVEGEREARRAARGFVDPRQARAFLAYARAPLRPERDPVTRAYFRELAPVAAGEVALPVELADAIAMAGDVDAARTLAAPASPVTAALRLLDDATYDRRMAELAYLANVLVAGATAPAGGRYTIHAASVAVLAAVDRALARRGATAAAAIAEVLRAVECDRLFREDAAPR